MEELNVKNVIISKQFEDSENLQEFLSIVKDKYINVRVIEAATRINIEKDLYFDVLWPSLDNVITENSLNNNSIVCKLNYNNFSMLFTGDIEKIAEEQIPLKYGNSNILNSNILKVAHHGSKTSSTETFVELVSPQIALIGVGKTNTFGHPNEEVLERLTNMRCKGL